MTQKKIITLPENKRAVFRYIMDHSSSTREDLHLNLGLSLPTIAQSLFSLEDEQMIIKSGKVSNTSGRKAVTYSCNGNKLYAAGMYFTANHIGIVLTDMSGKTICSKRIRVKLDLQDISYRRLIGENLDQVIASSCIDKRKIIGVGLAVPSLVSQDGENIEFGMTSNFNGIDRETISEFIHYPTRLFHDSETAVFAEMWGNVGSLSNTIYLNLNNSIGSAIVINGKIYSGNDSRSGEIGHMIVHPHSGKKCYCGQIGCFDTVCNAGILDSYTNGDLGQFFQLVNEKDVGALKIWDQYLDDLALAIHNLRAILNCRVVIGGYVGNYIDPYMRELYKRLDAISVFTKNSSSYVKPCKYKFEATAAGAALKIIDYFIYNMK